MSIYIDKRQLAPTYNQKQKHGLRIVLFIVFRFYIQLKIHNIIVKTLQHLIVWKYHSVSRLFTLGENTVKRGEIVTVLQLSLWMDQNEIITR
jgi:hypothetical protein